MEETISYTYFTKALTFRKRSWHSLKNDQGKNSYATRFNLSTKKVVNNDQLHAL